MLCDGERQLEYIYFAVIVTFSHVAKYCIVTYNKRETQFR
jgi:hypothetical protein